MTKYMLWLICLSLIACDRNEYSVALPNGYSLVRMNAVQVDIFDPTGSGAVESPHWESTITGYRVENDIVLIELSDRSDSWTWFFIIDTSSPLQEPAKPMNKEDWLASIEKLGLSPSLRSPP